MSEVIYPAAAPKDPKPLPQQLLDQFLYQKLLALERAGVPPERRPSMSPEKARDLYGGAMEKMASVLSQWNADPSIVMEACFAYSRSKKHMNGPQLNMLGSPKYLLQAIAYHMELPKEAAADLVSKDAMLRNLKTTAAKHEASIRRHLTLAYGSDDPSQLNDERKAREMSMFTSVPAIYRFLICATSIPLGRLLIPEVLEDIRVDAKQRLWAQHCGWSYRGMATYYRVIQPRTEDDPE